MIIKVSGVRDPENFREICKQDVDWVAFDFCAESPRYMEQLGSRGGFYPDYSSIKEERPGLGEPVLLVNRMTFKPQRAGIFVDDMPQTIVTRIFNFGLDFVQLDGDENTVMMQNLRRTVDPDIREGLKIIKTINVDSVTDFDICKEYEGEVDYFLFRFKGDSPDLSLLEAYKGDTSFLVDGSFGPDDAEAVRAISHPKFVGVDINTKFETEPGVIDIDKVQAFVNAVRA